MREIKFRAWNKKTEQYIDFEELGVGVNSLAIKFITPSGRTLYLEHGNSIILEQYTGLRDRNGVEIYEGDIVGFPENTTKESFGRIKQVGFIEGEYCLLNDWGQNFLLMNYDKMYILGNIHENQELLKKGE